MIFRGEEIRKIDFRQIGDDRGSMVAVEGNKDIPFDIKRAFYVYGTQSDVVRGKHANKKSAFVLINICGSTKIKVKTKDEEEVFELNSPDEGLYLPTMIWKDMYDFSEDSILLVLSNAHYDADEYIRDYDQYIREIDEG